MKKQYERAVKAPYETRTDRKDQGKDDERKKREEKSR
jgi:hypothetical protein